MNKFMKVALQEAKKAFDKQEVPIGAVIVKDNKIISRAHNLRETKTNSLAHAEIIAINKACKKLKTWRLNDCTMYITLEPCMMCAGAISQARIDNIVFGALDNKNGVIMSKANVLDIDITNKVNFTYEKQQECSNILTNFFKELRKEKTKVNKNKV